MDALSAAVNKLDLQLHGRSNRLGLISINQKDKPMLYAHIVEHSDDTTDISFAPGRPLLKDADRSELPESTIQKILKTLETKISKNT